MKNQCSSYDQDYYQTHCSVDDYIHNESMIAFFDRIAEVIKEELSPRTVLDVGCACGHLVKSLRDRGIEAYGVDISEYALDNADKSIRDYVGYLRLPEKQLPPGFPNRFDLTVNIEVLEHLPEESAQQAIQVLTSFSDRILFSSTPSDFEEETHLNVQPISYWCRLFEQNGYLPVFSRSADAISLQAVCFQKTTHFQSSDIFSILDAKYETAYHFSQDSKQQLDNNIILKNSAECQRKNNLILLEDKKQLEAMLGATKSERDKQFRNNVILLERNNAFQEEVKNLSHACDIAQKKSRELQQDIENKKSQLKRLQYDISEEQKKNGSLQKQILTKSQELEEACELRKSLGQYLIKKFAEREAIEKCKEILRSRANKYSIYWRIRDKIIHIFNLKKHDCFEEYLIRASGLFDENFYLSQVTGFSMDPIRHYCRYGWGKNLAPMGKFDPVFYRIRYPDSIEKNPFFHYIENYYSRGMLIPTCEYEEMTAKEISWVEKAKGFDPQSFMKTLLGESVDRINGAEFYYYLSRKFLKAINVLLPADCDLRPENMNIADGWVRENYYSLETVNTYYSPEAHKASPVNECIDVIIPVYNGMEHLKRLFKTLFKNTESQKHRFIIVDDCSPDPTVWPFLQAQTESRQDCILLQNPENLGFPGTVNRAAAEVKSSVFILLNTDVLVPPNWLERMVEYFYRDERIGTVTPFTNSAVFFSYPVPNQDNTLENFSEIEEIDQIFQHLNGSAISRLEFINGTGFCMAIRKFCWDELGGFDAEAFEKGYGEESDLCMRFLAHGWKNILQPCLYVYHNHGGSFNPENKKEFTKRHLNILNERWSHYINLLTVFNDHAPWNVFRFSALINQLRNRLDVLIIDLANPRGGAYLYRVQQEKAFIEKHKKIATLTYTGEYPPRWEISFILPDGKLDFPVENVNKALDLICFLNPKHIFINNLAFCQDLGVLLGFFNGLSYDSNFALPIEPLPAITEGITVKATILSQKSKLNQIQLFWGTYIRKNTGFLQIAIKDCSSGHTIHTMDMNLEDLADISWGHIRFPALPDSEGKMYELIISGTNGTPGNSVTCFKLLSAPDSGEKLWVNDNPVDGNLCRILTYDTQEHFCADHKIEITYHFHDFLSCCPSFFLLNQNGLFCNYEHCEAHCLLNNPNIIVKEYDLDIWREYWSKFLQQCTTLRFFSENTYNLVSRVYELDKKKILIKPHDQLCIPSEKYLLDPTSVLRVAVIGAWAVPKGCRIIEELSDFLEKERPQVFIYFYGYIDEEDRLKAASKHKNIIIRGIYTHDNLPRMLTDDKITIAFLSSVYPETFSFVTQECIQMNIPLLSFDLGASGDRIKKYEHGFIAEDFSVPAIYQQLLSAQHRYLTAHRPKRLVLFMHWDADGLISEHDVYFLKSLKEYVDDIIFISNVITLTDSETSKISSVCSKILIRSRNAGYDFYAWAETFLNLDEQYIQRYDEIFFINNSCLGPVFDFSPVMTEMENCNTDFWGLVAAPAGVSHTKTVEFVYPDHLQSFFLMFRKTVFGSTVFRDFMQKVECENELLEVVRKYETKLTQVLKDAGFTCSALYEMEDDFDSLYIAPMNYLNKRFPLVKKKMFSMAYQENVDAALIFLFECSNYPNQYLDKFRLLQ